MNSNDMMLTDWDDIREALAMGFTGSVVLVNLREVKGNVSPCDIVGSQRTGQFTDVTVTPVSGYQVPRRIHTADILAVVVRDI